MPLNRPDAAAFPVPPETADHPYANGAPAIGMGLSKREYALVHAFSAIAGGSTEPISAKNVQLWAKLAEIVVDCWIMEKPHG